MAFVVSSGSGLIVLGGCDGGEVVVVVETRPFVEVFVLSSASSSSSSSRFQDFSAF